MAIHRLCDGTTRRDALKFGILGTAGLTLERYLRIAEASELPSRAATGAIFIHLAGGPSHVDTFDLKPEAPDEIRGEFKPIDTTVPGMQISEHLPKLAQAAEYFALLRGVSHTLAAHELGSKYMNTGNRPLPSLEFPGFGAIASHELESPRDLPPFVAIPDTIQKGGYLGVKYAPLSTGAMPQPGKPFQVRGIALRNGVTVMDVEKREQLLQELDHTFEELETDSPLLEGLDRFSEQAHTIITSPRARQAFDIGRESPAFAEPFGKSPFGQSCLLATRLIESGVRFVTLTLNGWDTHNDNFNRLKQKQLPVLDEGLAALFVGLKTKGLLDSTAIVVTGEFGRTPKINQRTGRDHYPRAMFVLMAGGGVRGGQVLGESDSQAMQPVGNGFAPDDIGASLLHCLGIDHRKEYQTHVGRPITIVRDGKLIPQLFG